MSIRIRSVDGVTVALCAARSMPKPGDIYLDDSAHMALSEKFAADFQSMGYKVSPCYPNETAIREREESNNPNRDWWDKTYGGATGNPSKNAGLGAVEGDTDAQHDI